MTAFIDSAKVMAKGQVTIPKDVRKTLGVSNGDRISFIVEGNTVRIVNSAVYAMQVLQQEMAGEAQKAGLVNDDDIVNLVAEMRKEEVMRDRRKKSGGLLLSECSSVISSNKMN